MLPLEAPAEPFDVAAFFRRLAGHWRQARTIAPGGTYTGQASFLACGAGCLDYVEQGTVTLPDRRQLQATQRYLFALEGPGIAVYFKEDPPRLFHQLNFTASSAVGTATAAAGHLCGDDDYRSLYTIHATDRFTVVHEVNGPRKAYVMTTDYDRTA